MKGNKQADVFGERMERGRGTELLNFHSRFSERSEWWIIETWKVIKYGSLKRWGQVPKTPAETEGSGSHCGPAVAQADTLPEAQKGTVQNSPVVFPLACSPSPSARASGWIWLQIRPPGGERKAVWRLPRVHLRRLELGGHLRPLLKALWPGNINSGEDDPR